MEKYDNSTFYIVSWETNKALGIASSLNDAKKEARSMGHNGAVWGNWYAPMAFVAHKNVDENCKPWAKWAVVYNPRFKVTK